MCVHNYSRAFFFVNISCMEQLALRWDKIDFAKVFNIFHQTYREYIEAGLSPSLLLGGQLFFKSLSIGCDRFLFRIHSQIYIQVQIWIRSRTCLRVCLLWRIRVVKVITHICTPSSYWPTSVGNQKVTNSNVFPKNWNIMLLASEGQLFGEWCHCSSQNIFYKGMRSAFERINSFQNIIYKWMWSFMLFESNCASNENRLGSVCAGIHKPETVFSIAQDMSFNLTLITVHRRPLQAHIQMHDTCSRWLKQNVNRLDTVGYKTFQWSASIWDWMLNARLPPLIRGCPIVSPWFCNFAKEKLLWFGSKKLPKKVAFQILMQTVLILMFRSIWIAAKTLQKCIPDLNFKVMSTVRLLCNL